MLILRESIASIVLCFTCFVFSLFFFLFSTLNGNILVIYDVLFVFTEISEVLRKVLLQLNSFHAHLHFSSISFTNGTTLLFSFDLFEMHCGIVTTTMKSSTALVGIEFPSWL